MSKPPLPPIVVTGGTVLIGVLLGVHVVFDMVSHSYSNPTLSLALLAAFCAALGLQSTNRGGG